MRRYIFFGGLVVLGICIAYRYSVMITGRSVILKLREWLVHVVAESVLPEMSVILWKGEILLSNLWYPKGNNKNIILIKGRGKLEWTYVITACSVVMN
jgi:hypothetical protein